MQQYQCTVNLPAIPQGEGVASRRLSVIVNGTAKPDDTFGITELVRQAGNVLNAGDAVTVSLVHIDAAGNLSPARVQSGIAPVDPPPPDTTPPSQPSPFTLTFTPYTPPPPPGGTLATPTFSAGWATFGLPLAQGELPSGQGLQVGALATQTDVKATWADGSAKHCIVTCKPTASGPLAVSPVSPPSGAFTPTIPAASVTMTVGGTPFVATMPSSVSSDLWLDGSLAKEWRHYVVPVDSSSNPQTQLRVTFDCRACADGTGTVSVKVENVLDLTAATVVQYDLSVSVAGSVVLTKTGLKHWYTTNWCETFPFGGYVAATIGDDLEPFHRSKALPRFRTMVADQTYDFNTDPTRWDIMQRGGLSYNQMNQAAARPELGFFPDWVVQYIVHLNPTQKEWTIRTARHAGSHPVHMKEADGSYILLTNRPTFWFDYNGMSSGAVADRPKGNLNYDSVNDYSGGNPFMPDRAHRPDFILPAYLLTGERYLADEMAAWSLWDTANIPPSWRGDTEGRQVGDSARGTAWPLRALAGASAFLPDSEPVRPFLRSAVIYSLAWYDRYAAGQENFPYYGFPVQNALGTSFEIQDQSGFAANDHTVYVSTWQQAFVCYAIQRCNDLGFVGGLDLLDRMAKFLCLILDSAPAWPQDEGVPYYPMVGTWSGTYPGPYTWVMSATPAEAYQLNADRAAGGELQRGQMGWPWNTDTRVFYTQIEAPAIRLADRRSLPHAAVAKAVVEAYLAANPTTIQASYAIQEPWY